MKKVRLFDLDFNASDNLDEIVDDIFVNQDIGSSQLPVLITPNVDQVVKLNRLEFRELRKTLENAKYILPDGQPIVTLSKLKLGDKGLRKRLTGADLFIKFWHRIRESDRKVLLVVPSEKVGTKLKNECSNTEYYCPPFYSPSDTEVRHEIIKDLKMILHSFRPDFIIIGLGFPKQELLFIDLLEGEDQTKFPLTLLLGASFEFYLGIKKRAPRILQKFGLEFMHRFVSEPKRMFKRYFVDDLGFIPLAIRELRKS